MDTAKIEKIRHYIAALPVGLPAFAPEAKPAMKPGILSKIGPRAPVNAATLASLPDGLVTGSNLVQFSQDTGPELRSAVALSLLAAQRVAAANQTVASPSGWVGVHNAVLQNLGWMIEDGAYATETLSGDNLAVHEAIIPVLTAAFGPAAAAGSLILTALNQLKTMDQEAPWITLFEHNSRRFDVHEFQFTVVEKVGSRSALAMVSARFDGKFNATQVLFFKLKSADAQFESARTKLSANSSLLSAMNDDLQAKLIGHVKSYIATLDV